MFKIQNHTIHELIVALEDWKNIDLSDVKSRDRLIHWLRELTQLQLYAREINKLCEYLPSSY